jgi:hypothetical protein
MDSVSEILPWLESVLEAPRESGFEPPQSERNSVASGAEYPHHGEAQVHGENHAQSSTDDREEGVHSPGQRSSFRTDSVESPGEGDSEQ